MTGKAWQFVIVGGLFTIGNIVMTGWLFFNLNKKNTQGEIQVV